MIYRIYRGSHTSTSAGTECGSDGTSADLSTRGTTRNRIFIPKKVSLAGIRTADGAGGCTYSDMVCIEKACQKMYDSMYERECGGGGGEGGGV